MVARVRRTLPWGAAAAALYLAALAAVSLRSQERVLGFEQPKRLCHLGRDCRRTIEVRGVTRMRAIGGRAAEGEYWVVTLRNGRDAHGGLAGLRARARTSEGAWYGRDAAAEARLPSRDASDTRIVFDLPAGAEPLLDVRDGRLLSRLADLLMIGDEASLLHRRTLFALSPAAPTATIGPLSVSLVDVETDTTAGAPWPVPADGVFWVVTVAVSGRGAFDARIVDATGRRWLRARDVEERLPPADQPGRRYVFDVADGAPRPMLEIRPAGVLRAPVRIPLT